MPRVKGRRVTYTKYTDDYVDFLLLENKINIKRIGTFDYDNNTTKFQCLVCEFSWSKEPRKVCNGTRGCPNCAGSVKITNEVLDERIKYKAITRIGDIGKNIKEYIDFSCNICDYIWPAAPDNVMNNESGCPQCSGNVKITDSIIDERIKNKNIPIIRVGNLITNSQNSIDFMCKKCNHIWPARPYCIYLQKSGCPKCSQHAKLTNIEVDFRLFENKIPIKRVDNVEGSNIYIKWQCLKCDKFFRTSPYRILNKEAGCTKCNKHYHEGLVGLILDKQNILYTEQYSIYVDGKIYKEYPKFIDYYLYDNDYNLFIEYNGIQHYEPARFGGMTVIDANKALEKQIKRDEDVRYFALLNNINYYEIDCRNYTKEKLKSRGLNVEQAMEIDILNKLKEINEIQFMKKNNTCE